MVYILYMGGNGYCGCDWEEVREYDSFNEDEFNETLYQLSCDYAESYEHVATGWDGSFETEEDRDDYYNCAVENGNWREISREEYQEYL